MRIPVRPVAILLGALLSAACNDTVSGPASETAPPLANVTTQGAEREVSEILYDMNGTTITVVCEDETQSEPVLVSGMIAERYTSSLTPSGMIHYSLTTMPIGLEAIGLESGAKYKIRDSMHAVGRQSSMGSNNTSHSTFRLESKETGQRFRFSYTGNYTFNANGVLTVYREKAVAICER